MQYFKPAQFAYEAGRLCGEVGFAAADDATAFALQEALAEGAGARSLILQAEFATSADLAATATAISRTRRCCSSSRLRDWSEDFSLSR
ncbi:hypothetical protein ABZS79_34980 [Streptomyces griseoloalbus]|uniref:hypothetical protein n=1 Tax=Streptomyces griseoloalbus TaxID=67303 RepID=UPI0033AF566C